MRQPAAVSNRRPRVAKSAAFAAPIGGWIRNQNLSTPGARMPDGSRVSGAFMLENYFPTATGIRMRAGSLGYSQLPGAGAGTDVVSMFAYVNGNNKKLFAANTTSIWDISTPIGDELLADDLGDVLVDDLGDPIIGVASAATAAVGSLTGGDWQAVQFATPGGVFLRAVNGLDTPLVYDGAAWGTAPAITVVTPETLSYVWVHQRRLFFVQKDSLNAWYLPADSVGGAAVLLPLGGVFTRGGSLLFGSSWSLETGNGLTEQCAFVSTEGEVAVYQGTDPGSSSTWSKVGVYRIGKPLGARSHIRAGGDLVIATDIGLVPLSQAVQRDYSALSASAVSYPIETAWNEAVAARSGTAWPCEVWPTKQMVLVALPTSNGDSPQVFAANARTGAWGLFTGWQVSCLQLFGDRMFFGSANGWIVEAEVTGADQGAPYTATCVPLFDALKSPASLKISLMMRAMLRAPVEVIPQLSLQADYTVNLPPAPDASTISGSSLWGSAIWGQSQWGGASVKSIFERWQSVGGSGYALAPAVQITSGGSVAPDLELVQVDMTYDVGDIVT